jgi:hypothetical protein
LTEESEEPPLHQKRIANPDATCPSVRNKPLNELIVAAWDAGWWCIAGGRNHVKCYPPDDGRMIPVPSTPSDHRTCRNKRAQFRRGGLDV